MKLTTDCLDCIRRQAERLLELVKADPSTEEAVRTDLEALLANCPEHLSPAEVGFMAARLVEKHSGVEDPFADMKKQGNETALSRLDWLRSVVKDSGDALEAALLLACAGNRFRPGVDSAEDIETLVESVRNKGLSREDMVQFRQEMSEAASLVYLTDHAGEVVFDRVLLETLQEHYPGVDLTVAVSRKPLLDHATVEDARAAGLDKVAEVMDRGYEGAAVVLSQAGDEFQLAFSTADVILSKGSSNYQTLDNRPDAIYYLLVPACGAVAEALGVGKDDPVFVRSEGLDA
jgi:damage-control phosphatase, subfamily I